MTDRRAKIHIVGPKSPVSDYLTSQRCTRCHAVIGDNWPEGASVASYGHGGWSVVEKIREGESKYRPCGRKVTHV
jgi:hypothetical protein